MRTIKELLQLMLDNQHLFEYGLCGWTVELRTRKYISLREYLALKQYIFENKPTNVDDFYWWDAGDIIPRIAWIKEQIKKLKNEK